MASRIEPSPLRAMRKSASSSASIFSWSTMNRRRAAAVARPQPGEVETLAARENRLRHLQRLGGGEDEDHVRRGLLQRLQQGVEGVGGQHVDFVDDVDLAGQHRRRVADRLAQLADVVDPAVAGAVDLDHVHGVARR